MEEVQRIRESLTKGEPVLSESQVELIKHLTAFIGEDGEAVMREIQEEATKTVRLPADIPRIIDNYCKDLIRRVGLRELSNDLEKDKERERRVQLETMEAEVSNFKAAKAKGNMADLTRVKGVLPTQLRKYLEDIEADEGDGISSDATGKWKETALGLTKDAMDYLNGMGRDVGAEGEDALGPLRRAIGKVASLGEAVTVGVIEQDEEELRDLAKRLGVIKRELMAMGRGLMVNQPPATATRSRRGH
jgi:CRISPR/Cas system CSM-associated protein Csm2 small subunit